ncbi:putative gag-pol polyprotein [Gregarina niphandrodes]|uniref:Gag-pol polyprotein n=1 Tax=Gregarina niphandrodes TaxID=110365 RepID=A0A023B885_GRENI|nr:putative gag-pol polyprotein [Gregarina niphandrodes]EZG68681.1 putative gag-pol polyprotein [Gregarina niphandrodes]|eukprot:XP_011134559.1 putative gag-pol polyprotein [Gregarina niphandrodes]
MSSGFWNVPIGEFNVIPFGIKNPPAEFQRAMDASFEEVLGTMDGEAGMLDRIEKILWLCRANGFYPRLDESEWFKSEVRYLGHVTVKDGKRCQAKEIDALKNAAACSDKRSLQSFLGLVGCLRPFIRRFAEYTAPLFNLLKKGTVFDWGPRQADAFKAQKEAVVEAALLYTPEPGQPYTIETDASVLGIGAV